MNFKTIIAVFLISTGLKSVGQEVSFLKTSAVGDGIVEFIPQGFDKTKTPSLILKNEVSSKGKMPSDWKLVPEFRFKNNKASAVLNLEAGISLYGGGEVTGPLLRNGQSINCCICLFFYLQPALLRHQRTPTRSLYRN